MFNIYNLISGSSPEDNDQGIFLPVIVSLVYIKKRFWFDITERRFDLREMRVMLFYGRPVTIRIRSIFIGILGWEVQILRDD